MLFTGWEIGIENILAKSYKTAEAENRATFLIPRQNIFQSGLTLTVYNVLIFFRDTSLITI